MAGLAPIFLAIVLALIPPPEGLAPHAWYFFAIFAGVILGLMLEPYEAEQSPLPQ